MHLGQRQTEGVKREGKTSRDQSILDLGRAKLIPTQDLAAREDSAFSCWAKDQRRTLQLQVAAEDMSGVILRLKGTWVCGVCQGPIGERREKKQTELVTRFIWC
jgi:hypothetical protein